MPRSCLVLALVLACFSGLPVFAGQLNVVVTDRDGRALSGVPVRIEVVRTTDPQDRYRWIHGPSRATSDGSGKVRFSGLVPGSYAVHATPPDGFVDPALNPFAEQPRVTFTKAHERLEVSLALWRGGPLALEMEVLEGPERSTGRVQVRSLEGESRREISLEDGLAREVMLLPGRYEVALTPPEGLLLVDLSTSEQRLGGGRVLVEIEEGWHSRHVHWKVGASARIEGSLRYENTNRRASPVARLIAAGSWAEQLVETGGWELKRVRGRLSDRSGEHYEMFLPEGQWRVSIADDGLFSDPESIDLRVAAGGVGHADFLVRAEESPCSLVVSVRGPRTGADDRIRDALVGLWHEEDDPFEVLPLRVRSTGRIYRVVFRDLEPGDYRVVARHEKLLDAERRVKVVCNEEERRTDLSISLDSAAPIRFEARDGKGRPVRGALLVAEALDAPQRALFNEKDQEHFSREARSDDSGRGRLEGLPSGSYRLRPRMTGRHARELFVRIRDGAFGVLETKDVHAGGTQELQVQLLVLPAATIAATLVCDDGKKLPDAVDLRAFDLYALPAGDDVATIEPDDAELRLEALTLGGIAREDVTIGPLEEGSYLLALKPYGFERWSWLGSDRGPENADRLTTRVDESAPAGLVYLPCAPRAEISIELDDESLLEDLFDPHRGRASAEMILEPSGETRVLDADLREGLVVVGGIPPAEGEIRVVLEHPHLLPDGVVETRVTGRFERGHIATGRFPETALGGAIEVHATSPALQLSGASVERVVAGEDEGVLIAALEPGRYLLSACLDPECLELAGSPLSVIVEQGLTTVVELARDF